VSITLAFLFYFILLYCIVFISREIGCKKEGSEDMRRRERQKGKKSERQPKHEAVNGELRRKNPGLHVSQLSPSVLSRQFSQMPVSGSQRDVWPLHSHSSDNNSDEQFLNKRPS